MQPRRGFRAEVSKALRNRGPAPEDLIDAQVARMFWQWYGIKTELPHLDMWTIDKIERWFVVTEEIVKYEEAMAEIERQKAQRS